MLLNMTSDNYYTTILGTVLFLVTVNLLLSALVSNGFLFIFQYDGWPSGMEMPPASMYGDHHARHHFTSGLPKLSHFPSGLPRNYKATRRKLLAVCQQVRLWLTSFNGRRGVLTSSQLLAYN
jgi:hypothetical protein